MTIRAYCLAVACFIAACGGTTSPDGGSGAGGNRSMATDNRPEATQATGGGFCCTPSDEPSCGCMKFGGYSDTVGGCGSETCDGFRLPSRLEKDEHGCDVWTAPDPNAQVCGAVIAGDDTDAEIPGYCCPPSAAPACCMDFGGWHAAGEPCGQTCDGFALPTRIGKDAHGCSVWIDQTGPGCGVATLDAGPVGEPDAY